MRNFVIIFATLYLVISCSPVRNNNLSKKSTSNDKTVKKDTNFKKDSLTDERFKDTTLIKLPPPEVKKDNLLETEFDQAVELFDKSKFDEACQKIRFFSNTLAEGDSLYYEAKYYECECEIGKNNLEPATFALEKLLKDRLLPEIVLERVLVRLGQIYCISKKESKAEQLFARLKNEFPNSQYLQVAECNSVNKK